MIIETARGIAARIWCDQDFQHMEMDVELAEEIAQKLMAYANKSFDISRHCACSKNNSKSTVTDNQPSNAPD